MSGEGGALRMIFAELGFKVDDKVLKDADKTVGKVTHDLLDLESTIKKTLGAFAAAASIGGVLDFVQSFAASAEALRDTARESRVTTTELQELDHAAVASGVGMERMRSGVATFGEGLRSAERWGNSTTATLRRLGIQARDSAGHIRPTGDVLDEVAVAMERVHSPTQRARIATQLFGAAGRRMLDVMHTGPGGIRALRNELEELGGGVTPEATENARKYTIAVNRLFTAQESLRSVLFNALAPTLTDVIDRGSKLAGLFARLTRGTHVVKNAVVLLGIAGAAAAAPMIAEWLLAAAPVLAFAAAVVVASVALDDLQTFADGGDSAIGRMLDRMGGIGQQQRTLREFSSSWEGVNLAITNAGTSLRTFWTDAEKRSQDDAKNLARVAATYAELTTAMQNLGDAVFGGLRKKIAEFLSYLSTTVGSLAQRLGLTQLAQQLSTTASNAASSVERAVRFGDVGPSTYANKSARKLPGRTDRLADAGAAADQFTRDHAAIGLVADLFNPVQVVRNLGEFAGNITGNGRHVMAPASQSVTLPGGARTARPTVVHRTSAPVMHFHGVTDANVIADRVRATIREEDRNRRDADSPLGQDDGE